MDLDLSNCHSPIQDLIALAILNPAVTIMYIFLPQKRKINKHVKASSVQAFKFENSHELRLHRGLPIPPQLNFYPDLLPVRALNPSDAEANIPPKHKDAKIFENHSNPVMLVFIG